MERTPLDTIRLQCLQCCGQKYTEVRTCDAEKMCVFHKYRMGRGRPSVKLFKKYCLSCMCSNLRAVENCTTTDCIVHPYRFGKRVNQQEMSEERKAIQISRVRTRRHISVQDNA